jgi:hypothetical protein
MFTVYKIKKMISKTIFKSTFLGALALFSVSKSNSQSTNKGGTDFDIQLNTITTAVPFLLIAPDSRATGMGDIGVATTPDANSAHWNPAKLAFAEDEVGVSFSYSPWLRRLGINDINLVYLTGYKKLDDRSAIAGGLRYFSLGSITFTDNTGATIREFSPNEFSLDGAYSVKLSDNFSGGLGARYIYSNLTGGLTVGSVNTKPGQSFAIDVAGYYVTDKFDLGGNDATVAIGMNVSNIGATMSYTSNSDRDFLPANLRLGSNLNLDIDQYNQFSVGLDLNKLLVPTPPKYDIKNPGQIISGRDNDVSVASGVFGSFTDAPGNVIYDDNDDFVEVEKGSVLKEELREVNISFGMEYWYAQKFAVRAGYFHEHFTKGNRRYFTMGAGMKFSKFSLDFSYLIPTVQNHPLANTIRFALAFNFSKGQAGQ